MSTVNKHGLSRDIPEKIKKIIRKNSYYGCIICGEGIVDYEHVDPLFIDSKEHSSEKMCLLCPHHHRYLANIKNKSVIKKAMKNPYCKLHPVKHKIESFTSEPDSLNISVGSATFKSCKSLLSINGNEILSIRNPESENAPFRINANFYDNKGGKTAVIENNNFLCEVRANWDLVFKANRILIKNNLNKIDLEIDESESNNIKILNLDFVMENSRTFICKDWLIHINYNSGISLGLKDNTFENMEGGIIIENGGIFLGKGGGSIRLGTIKTFNDIKTLPNLLKLNKNRVMQYLTQY